MKYKGIENIGFMTYLLNSEAELYKELNNHSNLREVEDIQITPFVDGKGNTKFLLVMTCRVQWDTVTKTQLDVVAFDGVINEILC